MMREEPPELMTVTQIVTYTGMSRRTVYRWIAAGRLAPAETGSAWARKPRNAKYRKTDVDALRLKSKQP
jgi:excisionase family DNA binding protein